jgi:hypothetical protein
LNCFALTALFLAIFIPHLLGLSYSITSFEVGFFAIASVLLGLGIGYVARNRFVFGAILGLGIYFFLDAYFLEGKSAAIAFALCIFGTPLLLRFAPNGIPLGVLVFSIFFVLPDLFKTPEPAVAEQDNRIVVSSQERPPVAYIHLILDEQMSPLVATEAMPSDFTPTDFFDPYLQSGFQVYGLANSISKSTVESLSAVFGISSATNNYTRPKAPADHSYQVRDNQLVQTLVDQGFSTTVVESTYLQLCDENQPINCQTYSRASNLGIVETLGLPWSHRLQLAFTSLHQDYYFGAKPGFLYQHLANGVNASRSRPAPESYGYFGRLMVNIDILREIAKQAADLQPGDAIIAHLLVPHYPYSLDRECALRVPSEWGYPVREDHYEDAIKAYRTFWDQAICTGNLIGNILEHIKDRDDVVMFVHGDHGGRILFTTELENDADNLGTFMAVKAPNLMPGLDEGPVDLQETFNRDFMSAINP